MGTRKTHYLRIGSHRVPFVVWEQGADGSDYVIFPMDRTGFHLSKHPFADPHLKDDTGFHRTLDLSALRSMNWDEIAKEWEPWWNSLFYWPSHRADLIAIPGPPGKTWFEGLMDTFREEEVDMIKLVKFVLGNGTIYKVGYGARTAFFSTPLGRTAAIVDEREERFGAYMGGPDPSRPLMGLRWDTGGSFTEYLPGPLRSWQETINIRMEASIEKYFDDVATEMEAAVLEVLPEIEAFMENFRIVRWKSDVTEYPPQASSSRRLSGSP